MFEWIISGLELGCQNKGGFIPKCFVINRTIKLLLSVFPVSGHTGQERRNIGMISIVILNKKNKVIASYDVGFSSELAKMIIPNRKSAPYFSGELWTVADDKVDLMVSHVEKQLEALGTDREKLFGFFAIEGVRLNWIESDTRSQIKVGIFQDSHRRETWESTI